MYGPDIVLHSENMAASAMQENSPHPPFPGELPVCFSVMVFELMCMELTFRRSQGSSAAARWAVLYVPVVQGERA